MKQTVLRVVVGAAVLLSAVAQDADAQRRRQRDVITQVEIDSSALTDRDAFDMIKALRPHFFEAPKGVRTLGNANVAGLLLVIDNVRQTDALSLKSLRATDIKEARYLDPDRSQDEFGVMYNGGAIVVKTRKSSP